MSAAALMAMMAAGTATKASGQNQAARQEAALLKFRARLTERDARVKERETDVNIERAGKQASAISADQMAEFAASGVLPVGAPLAVMAEMVGELQKQVRDIGRVGFAEVEKLKTQSRLDRIRAKIAKRTGRTQVANTLLSGGAQIGMFAYNQGLFGGGSGASGGAVRVKSKTIRTKSGKKLGTLRGRKPKRKGAFAGTNIGKGGAFGTPFSGGTFA